MRTDFLINSYCQTPHYNSKHLPPSVTVEVSNKLRLESLPDPSSMSGSSFMPKSFGDELIKNTSLDMFLEVVEIVAA